MLARRACCAQSRAADARLIQRMAKSGSIDHLAVVK
jgi:hypothetical protein